jgi:hypothetical protein
MKFNHDDVMCVKKSANGDPNILFFKSVDDVEFIIHINKMNDVVYKGCVYPAITMEFDDVERWHYCSKKAADPFEPTNDIDDAIHWFGFNFSHPGVWDGRIYFSDEEFFMHELPIIQEVWNFIENTLRKRIEDNTNID